MGKIVCAAVRSWAGNEERVELFVRYPEKYLSNNAQIGLVGYEKGFITNHNRFVRPGDAEWIALKAGQLKFENGNVVPSCDKPLDSDYLTLLNAEQIKNSPNPTLGNVEYKTFGYGLKIEDLY